MVGDVSPKHCVGVLADLTLVDGRNSKKTINRCGLSAKGRLPSGQTLNESTE
jgi:hypothetical protein